ncbi:MAG TPA: cyclic nucleotide-binding domain-containing protein [Streptosporangiaceae bacterium]|nr:cyclic nucleotide-binding domain-containing protein [Streptosporangiaceae bacterium]
MTSAGLLTGFPAFDRLSPEHRAAIALTAAEVSIPAGATLFAEGEPASGCWLIRTGHVALGTEIPGRGEVTVQTLGPGDVLGWSWLVPPHYWQFTATALTSVTAVELDTAELQALAEADPALGYPLALTLFEVVVARLQSTRSRLLDLYGNPRER